MKKSILLFSLIMAANVYAVPTITDDFVVTKISLNQEKKYHEVSLNLMSGVYKADEKFTKCLQKSLEKKKAAKITYEAMGLKITDCEI